MEPIVESVLLWVIDFNKKQSAETNSNTEATTSDAPTHKTSMNKQPNTIHHQNTLPSLSRYCLQPVFTKHIKIRIQVMCMTHPPLQQWNATAGLRCHLQESSL